MIPAWLQHHLDSAHVAIDRLRQQPLASLLSIIVIGIALSLPTGLFLLVSNLNRVAGGLASQAEITLFLKDSVTTIAVEPLMQKLRSQPGIASVRFISREEGLRELQKVGLDDALTSLPDNPLPNAIVVRPDSTDPSLLIKLELDLKQRPEVDTLARAGEWAQRLSALLSFGTHLTWMLAGVLGLALAFITGNTIRLQIYALREEIEVSRLIGAADRFIRRPFLYFGFAQGLLGGLAACLIAAGGTYILNLNVGALAATYGSDFRLQSLHPINFASILLGASLLGLTGAWSSVSYTLREFE